MAETNDERIKNNLWRRFTDGVRGENVLRMVRSFKRGIAMMMTYGHTSKANLVDNEDDDPYGEVANGVRTPIYKGPMRDVPYPVNKFNYPTNGFLSGTEIITQLKLLVLRFKQQKRILDKYKNKDTEGIPGVARVIDEKVDEINELAEKVRLRQCIEESGLDHSKMNMMSVKILIQQLLKNTEHLNAIV